MIFRQSADTFTVEEIPLFECSGEGEHTYVTFRRRNISTPYLLRQIQQKLRLKEVETGKAGNKDRDATSIQTISIPSRVEAGIEQALESLGAEIISVKRHTHKLRTGKLAGNRFIITIELESDADKGTLEANIERIVNEGMPNAFGPQRFGDGKALEQGRLIFTGRRPGGSFRRSTFAVSAFQSHIFNRVLEIRRREGFYPGPVEGDLMKKHSTGGQFIAEAIDTELIERVDKFEISPTGPLPGKKVETPLLKALEIEEAVMADEDIDRNVLLATRAPGTRRFLRVPIGSVECSFNGSSYSFPCGSAQLSFSLPPGSYATVLLAELGVRLVRPERDAKNLV